MTRLGTLLPLLLLGACAQWPPEGTGGLAEMRPEMPKAAEGPLAQRLACALERLSVLETAAARAGQGTGQAAMLRVMATRATREAHGNLSRDANQTLDRLGSGAAVLQPVVGLPTLRECT